MLLTPYPVVREAVSTCWVSVYPGFLRMSSPRFASFLRVLHFERQNALCRPSFRALYVKLPGTAALEVPESFYLLGATTPVIAAQT